MVVARLTTSKQEVYLNVVYEFRCMLLISQPCCTGGQAYVCVSIQETLCCVNFLKVVDTVCMVFAPNPCIKVVSDTGNFAQLRCLLVQSSIGFLVLVLFILLCTGLTTMHITCWV